MENSNIVLLKHHFVNFQDVKNTAFYRNQCPDIDDRIIIDVTSRVVRDKEFLKEHPNFPKEISPMYAGPVKAPDGNIGTHKVIVVDDPICSLDSSILYVVSSLVRELTDCAKKGINNIDQVFILTHNVYFHKEVSFMDGRNQTDNKASFWTLHKKNEISTVKSYNNKNPITTSYALLWKEVKNSNSISSVSLQNAMRRILENFFGTLGNANFGDILKHFDSPEEQSICRSLFSWTNDGSHSIPDDLEFSEDNDSSEKFKKVFKDVFYNTHNQYHYDRMME